MSSSGSSSFGGIDGKGFSSRTLSRGEYSSGIVPMESGLSGGKDEGEFKAYISRRALRAVRDPTERLRLRPGIRSDSEECVAAVNVSLLVKPSTNVVSRFV